MNLSEKVLKLNFVSLTGAKKKKPLRKLGSHMIYILFAKYPFSIGMPNAKSIQFSILYKVKQIKSYPGLT